MENYKKHIINIKYTLLDALRVLNNIREGALTLFVLNDEGILKGTLTDGDIRRAIIKGFLPSDPIEMALNKNFYYLSDKNRCDILHLKSLKSKGINIIPYLTEEGQIKTIYDLKRLKSILPIDAVLMAGGKGERLRPLTEKVPKPLLKVGNRSIIDYNIDRLISYGIENISVTINYLREQIEEHFKDKREGIKVKCIREPNFLGTIGSIKFVDSFQNDTVLVMNSDLFTNIDFEDFYLHFLENDADMSVCAVPYSVNIPYGIFELDGRIIKGVKEKPSYNYYANAGIYLIKKKLLDMIPADTFYNATDFMEKLISKGHKVIRFPLTGYWIDIGKHEDYQKAQELVKHL